MSLGDSPEFQDVEEDNVFSQTAISTFILETTSDHDKFHQNWGRGKFAKPVKGNQSTWLAYLQPFSSVKLT